MSVNGQVVAWFSAGITSAVACKLAIDTYPDVHVIYIDIASAHPDNLRFIRECEAWYQKRILVLSNGRYRDQFQVIDERRYINGPAGALCTFELKKRVRELVEAEIFPDFSHMVFGMEFTKAEVNRAIRFKEQNPSAHAVFPLIDARLTKNECAGILQAVGIDLPAMYLLGFRNNNCIGCVKGGMFYWNLVRKHFPGTFDAMVQRERTIGRSCIKGTFLDDLPENAGRAHEEVTAECGVFCQTEFTDMLDSRLGGVLNGAITMAEIK